MTPSSPPPQEQVISSAVAAARLTKHLLQSTGCSSDATVHVVGESGIHHELQAVGLTTTSSFGADNPDEHVDVRTLMQPNVKAVVVGLDRRISYSRIALAQQYLANDDVKFVATNADSTFPNGDHVLPGAGTIVAAIERCSARQAIVAGKPSPAFLDALRDLLPDLDTRKCLMVGDRCVLCIVYCVLCIVYCVCPMCVRLIRPSVPTDVLVIGADWIPILHSVSERNSRRCWSRLVSTRLNKHNDRQHHQTMWQARLRVYLLRNRIESDRVLYLNDIRQSQCSTTLSINHSNYLALTHSLAHLLACLQLPSLDQLLVLDDQLGEQRIGPCKPRSCELMRIRHREALMHKVRASIRLLELANQFRNLVLVVRCQCLHDQTHRPHTTGSCVWTANALERRR
jgi:HAD superfamily hydrolase (TIGR01450 family)